ncbi:MAG: acetamidase/formamidase family protein [Solirubrobacteraceae bacterium]
MPATPMAAAEHRIDPHRIHHQWDSALEPALTIASGDTVHYELLMAAHGQLHEGDTFEQARFDFDTLYSLSGPLYVEGARPGDTLRIEVLELTAGDWGWCVIMPGQGTLPDRFEEPHLRTFDLRDGETAELVPGVTLPFAPFLGTMGNHPGEPATASVFPPHRGGGNIDARHLTAGCTLWLPVWCEGALFSCGDPHAMQGDGEVCVAALECDMRASLRFTVEHRSIGAPQFRTPGPLTARVEGSGHHGVMGIAPDMFEATRLAVGAMIDWLAGEHSLAPADAYMLCSLAGDLKLLEVVDAGVFNVGLTLPRSVLGG